MEISEYLTMAVRTGNKFRDHGKAQSTTQISQVARIVPQPLASWVFRNTLIPFKQKL